MRKLILGAFILIDELYAADDVKVETSNTGFDITGKVKAYSSHPGFCFTYDEAKDDILCQIFMAKRTIYKRAGTAKVMLMKTLKTGTPTFHARITLSIPIGTIDH